MYIYIHHVFCGAPGMCVFVLTDSSRWTKLMYCMIFSLTHSVEHLTNTTLKIDIAPIGNIDLREKHKKHFQNVKWRQLYLIRSQKCCQATTLGWCIWFVLQRPNLFCWITVLLDFTCRTRVICFYTWMGHVASPTRFCTNTFEDQGGRPKTYYLNKLSFSTYTPQNKHGTWKWTLGKGDSYWKPPFPGSMLNFGGVYILVI